MNVSDLRRAFFSYGNNLGDFTRALETAKGMKETGSRVKFFNHGGVHDFLINKSNIDSFDLMNKFVLGKL